MKTDHLYRALRTTFVFLMGALVMACGENNPDNTTPEPEPGPVNKDGQTVVVLNQSERPTVNEIKSDGTVVFDGPDMSQKLTEGTIICSEPTENAPYGFLYKVKSVRTDDGKTIVTTEQACLEDAIEKCHISESFELTDRIEYIEFGDGTIARPIPSSDTRAEVSAGVKVPFKIKVKGDKVFFSAEPEDLEIIETDPNDENIEVIEYVGDDIKGKASISAEIGVSLEVKLALGVELDIDDWSLSHFALWVQPEFKAEADAGFVLEGKMSFKDIRIGKIGLTPITVWAGIVPVVITPSVGLYADVTASGKIKFKTKLLDLDFKYKFGVDYSDGEWSMINENTSKDPSFFELDKNFKATLEGELELVPTRVTIIPGLYNCDTEGSLYAAVEMPFKLSVSDIEIGDFFLDYYINPRIKATWGIEPSVKAKLTVLKHDLVDYNPKFTLASWTIFDRYFFPKMTELRVTNPSSTSVATEFSLTNLRESLIRSFMGIGVCYSEVNGGDNSLQQFGDGNYYTSFGSEGLYWDKNDMEEDIEASLTLENLLPNTHYYARPYFSTILGTKYGHIVEFNTSGNPLRVQTKPVTIIASTSATLNASVESGGTIIQEQGFCISSKNSIPTKEDNELPLCILPLGTSSCVVTGLSPNTKYYVRAFATNNLGIVYGSVEEFMTLPAEGVTTFSVSPTDINFETVEYETTKTRPFTVTNTGNGMLSFSISCVCHDNVFEVNDGGATYSLASGASQEFMVTAHGMKRNTKASCDIRVIPSSGDGTKTVSVKAEGWDNKPLTLETTNKTLKVGNECQVNILFGSLDYEITTSDESIVTVAIGTKSDGGGGRYDNWQSTYKYVNLKALATGTATIKVTDKERGEEATLIITVSAEGGIATPEAVDLGLPSGLKWASFNLGATKPEEFGDYYAWGETEPYYSSQDPLTWKEGKTGYNWASYKWCMGSKNTMTKYCSNSKYGYNGFTDTKTVLELEDDAAHVNLGSGWRMPTDAEWTELRNNCMWTWTTQNGVYGWLVTASNGNSIFLPAAGLRLGTKRYRVGSYTYYWSSSLDAGDPNCGQSVYFGGGDVGGYDDFRYYGRSVRPVSE